MSKTEANSRVHEIYPELLGVHALNTFITTNAPARGTMMSGHFAQRQVISGSEPNLILTGSEEEFGKYTFSVKMPEEGTILKTIPRFNDDVAKGRRIFNPETLVIYRSHETGEVGCFTVPYYMSHHPTFGFQYQMRPAASQLVPGASFEKGTVFADSPAVQGESHYTFGRNLNIAYMSHPSVGLDGYVFNREALKDFQFKLYENRTISCGANEFLLNLHGDDEIYRGLPEIGDYTRDDGLIAAIRKFDPHLAPATLSRKDLRNVNYMFDEKIYSRPGRGRVVDIKVFRSNNVNRLLPDMMTEQLQRYSSMNENYYRQILRVEEELLAQERRNGINQELKLTRNLHQKIVEAKGILNAPSHRTKQPLSHSYKREPLNSWRIEITIEYTVTPTRGMKFTCIHGGI